MNPPDWQACACGHAARSDRGEPQHRLLRSLAAARLRAGDAAARALADGADGFPAARSRRRCCGRRAHDWLGSWAASRSRLVFTANVQPSINIVAAGLRLAASGRNPADRPRIRRDALVLGARRPAPGADAAHVCAADLGRGRRARSSKRLRQPSTQRTRLLFFSHVLSPTGLVLAGPGDLRGSAPRGVS